MVFNNSILLGAAGQGGAAAFDTTLIGNSVWFDGSADDLDRSTTSHSSTEMVMACWFRLTTTSTGNIGLMGLGTGTSGSTNAGLWLSANKMYMYNVGQGAQTAQLFRDIGWYHVLGSWKLDESGTNKGKLYINGSEVTNWSDDRRSSFGTAFGSTATQSVGSIFTNTFLNGYIAQPVMLDGQSIQGGDVAITDFVDTFTFGTNGSQIIPKADADIAALATAAGGNSFCLDFSTTSVALSSGVTPTSNAGTVSGSLSNLTDGNFTTEWRSDVDPATNVDNDHVAFDLGSAKDVKAVKITGRVGTVTGNYKVQFSDNGSDFTDTGTTFSNVSITTTANSGILDLTSDNPGSHRYWKLINISNSSGSSGWGFKQIILASAVGNLGTDASGNGNDLTPNSMDSTNQSVNTPSKVYPIVNALTKVGSAASTLEEGNTKATVNDNGGIVINPKLPFSGLWYFEINVTTNVAWYPGIGQQSALGYNSTNAWGTTTPETHVWLSDHPGNYFNNNGSLSTYPIANPTTGRFAVAWDGDNRALYFGQISGSTITWTNSGDPTSGSSKTGAAPGNWPTTGTDPLYFIVLGGGTSVMEFDFDEDDWTGVTNRPADAKALNSANLTAPDYQGIDYFDATLYEGNGTGQRVGDFVPFTDAYTVDNSAMFEHDDVRYLSRTIETPSSPNGRKGTWSAWFKTALVDTDIIFFDTGTTATNRFSLQMDAGGNILFYHGSNKVIETKASFKGDGAWHNIVLKVDTELDPGESGATPNRAIMFIDGVQLASTDLDTSPTDTNIPEDAEIGYMDPGATQFVGSYNGSSANQWDGYLAEVVFLDNQYLNASSFGQLDTSTNRWVPKSVSGLTFGDCGFYLEFETAPNLGTLIAQGTGTPIGNMTAGGGLAAAFDGDIENYNAGAQANATSGNIGKDFGSSVTKTITGVVVKMLGNVTIDGGAAAETMTLTVERSANGTDFTTVYTESGISVAAGAIVTRRDGFTNTAAARYARISVSHSGGAETHISELEFYEGGSAGIGTDSSGNGNNFTQGGSWAASDQFIDTPSKNFNVFDSGLNGAGTLSEGNTQIVTATDQRTTYTTMNIPATGKWYWEVDVVNYNTGGSVYIGVVEFDELVTGNNPISGLTRQVIFDNFAGNAYIYSNSSSDNLGTTWCNTPGSNNFNADGDVLQFALDQDAGTLFIGNNNTWFRAGGSRDSFANATTVGGRSFKTGVKRRFLLGRGGSSAETYAINFGQHPNTFSGSSTTFNAAADGYFVYTPPTGYKAVNQDNLDDTASKLTAWAWIKNRDATDPHILVDRVRGVGEVLHSNATDLEATNTNTVQRFFQRGVQVGSDAEVNTANESYVLWQWLVGEAATTTTINASSTTPTNSIASTVAAADAGHFSVVGYQGNSTNGATVAHSLGGEPELIFFRGREGSGASSFLWRVFSTTGGAGKYLRLNDSTALQDDTAYLNNTLPGSVVFTLGTDGDVNNSSYTYIAYCFRSVPGVCKVGSYIGNLNDNGPYISLGFRPRWILLKSTTTARDWVVFDTSRDPTNMADHRLDPSNTGAEFNAALDLDILSDGFKFRSDDIDGNADGVPYIYLAMADIGGNGTLPPIYGR